MQIKKKLMYSFMVSSLALIGSIILPVIPCRIAPAVPNPNYSWTLCSLNPDTPKLFSSIKQYFGYTTSITDSYFIVLLLTFAVSMLFFHYISKRKNK